MPGRAEGGVLGVNFSGRTPSPLSRPNGRRDQPERLPATGMTWGV
ncbi:hypothetical protein EL18_00536 [Nitratireductor basaltis]|uniref:Uncharacterized protein n=1 Tax=Nitratireductor basaltis TaxID=472175 RepID=A0A084U984_9HYPH|nr:hypothetical protein EL18_00536 [Nitratireductor basaltis]